MKLNLTQMSTGNRRAKVLLFCMLLCSTIAYGQQQKVTLEKKNGMTLKEAFKQIEKQTKLFIDYNRLDINDAKQLETIPTGQSVREVMSELLKGSGCIYLFQDGHIIIKKELAQQSKTDTKKISGKVIDKNGEPIIGANILVEGTQNGVITDLEGAFTLADVPENAQLKVSYIGMGTQVVGVKGLQSLKVVLVDDTALIDEVVVVGYGTMKKKDLTGAISTVKMSDEPLGSITTISHALAGKAAGFQATTVSAQPGGGVNFRVRGAASSDNVGNDPLIIIDGFPVSDPGALKTGKYDAGSKDNVLASINPNDIESIEILKDASSTAIYGARAGNGVIIVTTKKGKQGAPKVQYLGNFSVQNIASKYEMLSASDFMTQTNRYDKEVWLKSNKMSPYGNTTSASKPFIPRYTDAQISNPTNETDWFNEITRQGLQTQHNISITGGSEFTKYLVSGNYLKQNGVVKNSGMERFGARVNLEHKLSKYVKAGINLTLSRNAYDNVPLGVGQNENASIMVSAAQFNPVLAIKDANNDYILNTEAAFLPNPVSMLEITDKTIKERLLGTLFVEVEPIKDLKLKANFGIDRNYEKRKAYLPKTTLYGQKEGGKADVAQSDHSDYLMELTANYSKTIGSHNFNVMVGHSFQQFNYESLSASNNRFLIDGFLFNNLNAGGAPKPGVGSSAGKSEMASFFGRANYSFMGRYLLTATLRADGASNFAKNNRWGYFPSASLGWRFSDEAFMQPLSSVISNGKLRASYGETGKSNIGNRAISFYQVGNNSAFGDNESKGVYLAQIGNVDLKWETTKEWNFGIDLGFFNNRINLTAEYFKKVISDRLSERALLSFQELDKIYANIGKTQSTGFELTLNTRNIDTKDFSWTSDLTFSFYRDKWKERDPSWKPAVYSIYDAPLRGNYGYLSDGIIQTGENIAWMPGSVPGQVKLKDLDGFQRNADGSIKVDENGKQLKTGKPDGKMDEADMVFYGSSDPGYLVGFNNTLRYKNFDLNIYFYGQFDKVNYGSYKDRWLVGADGMTGVKNMYRGYNMPTTVKDVWASDNTTATRPGFFQSDSSYGYGDFFKQDAWFIRCRNITLGYNIPTQKFKNIVSNVRIYADINNPFVITPYKGLDPETDNSVWAYPNVRSFSIGLDITF
ncbi:SusC/RagA family TonB-linked outer membrane protein [Bacteroides sp.]|uniref:SusC/RagA family TonB-linked outer membrane protein n=2 Tax=Bacteroides sp. TaxID=29523 RepID=UPI002FC9D66A